MSGFLGVPRSHSLTHSLRSRPASPPAGPSVARSSGRAHGPKARAFRGRSGPPGGGSGEPGGGGQGGSQSRGRRPLRPSPLPLMSGAAAGSERPHAPRAESPGDGRLRPRRSDFLQSRRLGPARPGPALHGIRSPRVPPDVHARPCTVGHSFASSFSCKLSVSTFRENFSYKSSQAHLHPLATSPRPKPSAPLPRAHSPAKGPSSARPNPL